MSSFLIVCVCDYWKCCHFNKRPRLEAGDSCSQGKMPLRRWTIEVDAITGNYYLREILQQRVMGDRLRKVYGVQLVWLEFHSPDKDTIDYRWAHMLAQTLWKHIEVGHLMSWLSTLGGGFSALGEQFERCAETAGKISLKQLKIGILLGDPFLQARCKLYYSISLIQRGQLRKAKHMIRQQHAFACINKEKDARLVRMCIGIWHRLSYEYEQRKMKKIKN